MICDGCKRSQHCKDTQNSCFCQHRSDALLQTESPLLPPKDNVKTAVVTNKKISAGKSNQ